MESEVKQYEYLWDGTAPQWTLMIVSAPDDAPEYLIVNTEVKATKLIEGSLEADEVIRRMLLAGVRVITPDEFRRRK